MTSKVFYCSKQRAMHLAHEVLREMKLRQSSISANQSVIHAERGWNFLSPPHEMEIQIFSEDRRVEVAVSVEPRHKMLDFGTSEYLEEEFLYRLRERIK